jgi:hypothetical protein
MTKLAESQLARQDFVDNSIFELMLSLIPSHKEIEWDIEMIGDVRDCIGYWLVERHNITDKMTFYPYNE